MPKVKLPREAFRRVLERANVDSETRTRIKKLIGDGANTVKITIDVADVPNEFLYSLLAEPGLNANQRGMISMRVHGISGNRADFDRIYESKVATPVEFASMFSALGMQGPNCELLLNGRWYPISLGTHCQEDETRLLCSVSLKGMISICDTAEHAYYPIRKSIFHNSTGEQVEKTVSEVLVSIGLRPLTLSNADHNLKLLNAERLAMDTGKLMWLSGPVLMRSGYEWWSRLQQHALGSKESPRKVIVEAELESHDANRGYYGQTNEDAASRLPFVRLFSLDSKRYIYADVDDLAEYEYDTKAIDRLHLPSGMLGILNKVFSAPTEAVFGDVIAGKHGGIVILASGKPGVGKTLTAEVYAETTGKPLYVLELGELGTKASEVEENLNRLFTRVARWNAVLQFDECEIFLAIRGNDLERSAIVGIFLRLLDYYRGILFLTTNRPEVLDPAILSRVTLELKYPDLDAESRKVIWTTMSALAGLSGVEDRQLNELAELCLNGRQIRNLVRLAKLLYENSDVNVQQLKEIASNAVEHNKLAASKILGDEAS